MDLLSFLCCAPRACHMAWHTGATQQVFAKRVQCLGEFERSRVYALLPAHSCLLELHTPNILQSHPAVGFELNSSARWKACVITQAGRRRRCRIPRSQQPPAMDLHPQAKRRWAGLGVTDLMVLSKSQLPQLRTSVPLLSAPLALRK